MNMLLKLMLSLLLLFTYLGSPAPDDDGSQTPVAGNCDQPEGMFLAQCPDGWSVQRHSAQNETARDVYSYILAQSPDYQQSSVGIPYIATGAELRLEVTPVEAKTMDAFMEEDPLLPDIAKNKQAATLGGQPALSYQTSYEIANTVVTQAIWQGNLYTVSLQYADQFTLDQRLAEYQKVVESFRLP